MRLLISSSLLLPFLAEAQQIYDIYSTTWDRSKLFTYTNLSPNPINFVTPGAIGAADIVVNDGSKFQNMFGFGASLTDSAALTLNNLKSRNADNYWSLLGYTFDKSDSQEAAGLSWLRIPIGASDFSANVYSLDDTAGDTSFNNFNIDRAPSYLFSVLKDILSINPDVKVNILPWSPPGWMKDSNTMNGGSLSSNMVSAYPTYLLKAVQGFQSKGINVYGISIQNEPQNSNPTYPTCTMSASVMAQIGNSLRTLLNNNGLSSVKVYGYDHNWDNAASYPVQLLQDAPSAFAGAAFHCYAGSVGNQDAFHNAFPNKEVIFTECAGTVGSDYWQDLKWYLDNIFIGSVEHWASTAMMWNLALDGNGNPILPGTNSCGGGCRAYVSVNSDGSYSLNQEWYAAAQANKAVAPKDAGGPWGQRIGVSVGGSTGWALRVMAYETKRVSSSDWLRYSLVVLNWNDGGSSGWNPQDVTATIEFRGQQARYTFPVGITTLWWFAPSTSSSNVKVNAVASNASFTNITASTVHYNATGAATKNVTTTKLQFNATGAGAKNVTTTPLRFNATRASTKNLTTTRRYFNATGSAKKNVTTTNLNTTSTNVTAH